MKTEVEYLKYMWPLKHFLITCGNKENKNIITVSFCMPVSKNPPLVVCAIGKRTHSKKLITEFKEYIINIPEKKLKSEVYYCGFHSGAEVDKFKETNLTPKPAKKVDVPIIDECIVHMECEVIKTVKTKEKILFIGEVIEAYAEKTIEINEESVNFVKGDFPEEVYSIRFNE